LRGLREHIRSGWAVGKGSGRRSEIAPLGLLNSRSIVPFPV